MNLDVDISLKLGEFQLHAPFRCATSALGVFGPSGSGKTTLLRALAGLVRPDRGHIRLDGETLFDSDRRIHVQPRKRHIGTVFQDARLFPHWSVEQNLRAGECLEHRIASRPYSFDDIVNLLDIAHLIGRSVEQLSGGEKQRIAMGRTLLAHPRLLLMDEPVAGIDIALKMQILPFLAEIHHALHIPTLLISHDLGDILQLTDRLLLMRDGSVAGHDTLDELARHPETLKELKGANLSNVFHLNVVNHDAHRGITSLALPDQPDTTLDIELVSDGAAGKSVAVGIAANQIALSLERIETISMRNQLPGRVRHIVHTADRSVCHLETSLGTLFAEITPGTERDMGLKEGSHVWALFKSRALRQF